MKEAGGGLQAADAPCTPPQEGGKEQEKEAGVEQEEQNRGVEEVQWPPPVASLASNQVQEQIGRAHV